MTPRWTLGLDLALSTGLVILDAHQPENPWVAAKQLQAPEKLHRYEKASWLASAILHNLPAAEGRLILIEDYAVGHKSSAVAVIELGAIIRYHLKGAGLSWLHVRPATLKKWTTGKGNAKKEQMGKSCKERWGVTFQCDDVCDAYALARMGQDPNVRAIAGVIET